MSKITLKHPMGPEEDLRLAADLLERLATDGGEAARKLTAACEGMARRPAGDELTQHCAGSVGSAALHVRWRIQQLERLTAAAKALKTTLGDLTGGEAGAEHLRWWLERYHADELAAPDPQQALPLGGEDQPEKKRRGRPKKEEEHAFGDERQLGMSGPTTGSAQVPAPGTSSPATATLVVDAQPLPAGLLQRARETGADDRKRGFSECTIPKGLAARLVVTVSEAQQDELLEAYGEGYHAGAVLEPAPAVQTLPYGALPPGEASPPDVSIAEPEAKGRKGR